MNANKKSDLHAEAMERIDGYLEADRDAKTATKWLAELRSKLGPIATEFSSPVRTELADAAAGDGTFPTGAGLRHIQAEEAAKALNIEIHEVQRFKEDSLARQREAIQYGSGPALAYLDELLADFVDELLQLAPELKALPDLETIAETGNTEALALRRRRPELVDKYLRIRATQTQITQTVLDSLSDSTLRSRGRKALLWAGQVREAIDVEKALLTRRRDALRDAEGKHGYEPLKTWWKADPDPLLSADDWGAPLPGGDVETQITALVQIVENTTPWVPSVDELLKVQELAEVATTQLYREGDDERIAKALEALAEATGYKSEDAPTPTGATPRPARNNVKLSAMSPLQRRELAHKLANR